MPGLLTFFLFTSQGCSREFPSIQKCKFHRVCVLHSLVLENQQGWKRNEKRTDTQIYIHKSWNGVCHACSNGVVATIQQLWTSAHLLCTGWGFSKSGYDSLSGRNLRLQLFRKWKLQFPVSYIPWSIICKYLYFDQRRALICLWASPGWRLCQFPWTWGTGPFFK